MKLAKTLAGSAAALCLAAGTVWAGDSNSSPSGPGSSSPSELSFEEQGSLILLEPVEAQALYGVDEDGDGLADYLILEEPDTIALFGTEEGNDVEVPEGG